MVINVNLTGRVMLPYIPDYIRNSKEKIKEEEKAYVVLKDINYGFVENLKARQIELFKNWMARMVKPIPMLWLSQQALKFNL